MEEEKNLEITREDLENLSPEELVDLKIAIEELILESKEVLEASEE